MIGNRPSPFARLIGMEFGPASPGRAEIYLQMREELMNFSDVGHGAVAMALMDTCCGIALGADAEGHRVRKCVTLSFTTNFLAPMMSGRLVTTAVDLGGGRKVRTCSSEVRDEAGALLAAGQGTFRLL